jgi:hypothetical protein
LKIGHSSKGSFPYKFIEPSWRDEDKKECQELSRKRILMFYDLFE